MTRKLSKRARKRQAQQGGSLKEERMSSALRAHCRSLGLRNADEYRNWCEQHGLSKSFKKTSRKLKAELLQIKTASSQEHVAKARKTRDARKVFEKLMLDRLSLDDIVQPDLKLVAKLALKCPEDVKRAFLRLLMHVESHTDFLSDSLTFADRKRPIIYGLLHMAKDHHSWIRPIEEWQPRTHNTKRQFTSLGRHLFAQYEVPVFMDGAWFQEHSDSEKAKKPEGDWRSWFQHIGLGANIRTAELPIQLTKKAAHHFLQAPDDYSILGAMRWGQVHALGGDRLLSDALQGTQVVTDLKNSEFWSTVVHFFVNNPMLDPVQVGPIIDFIHNQRHVPQEVFVRPGVMERRPPLNEEFSMKGRTTEALLRQVGEWHNELARESKKRNLQWVKSGFREFSVVEGKEPEMKRWTIRELLSSQALREEGKAMRHCVASYDRSCHSGGKSIWSLGVETGIGGRKRVLTIAVANGTRTIEQVRGATNRRPGAKELGFVSRWGNRENLTLASYA